MKKWWHYGDSHGDYATSMLIYNLDVEWSNMLVELDRLLGC